MVLQSNMDLRLLNGIPQSTAFFYLSFKFVILHSLILYLFIHSSTICLLSSS
jgi:hypothetical protein